MAVFAGFRPFLNKGSTVNGVRNMFFSDSSPGGHYLPDNTVVFNSSNLAVTGNSIAAILDKKNSNSLFGPELLINGNFSLGNANWTIGTGWTIGSNAANGNIGVGINLDQTLTTVLGKTYSITYTVNVTSGNVRVRLTGTANINGTIRGASGTYTEFLYASSSNSIFRISEGGSGFVGSITNVSVKEVSNNTSLQSTASLLPLLGSAPRIRTNLINNSEDLTTWATSSATTNIDKVMETTTVDMHVARAVAPEIYLDTDYYFTVEIKAAEKNYAVVGAWWTGGVAAGGVIVNLINGTSVGSWSRSPGNISATFLSSENMGDGWWRVKVYINNLSNAVSAHPIVGLTNSTTSVINESYAGINGYGVYVRKAHASLNPFTVYEKTESNRLITTNNAQTSFPFIRFDLLDDVLTTNNLISQKNQFRATEEFDNAVWTKSGISIVTNAATAPDGTLTADKIIGTNAHVGGKLIYQSPSPISSTYVYSFYAKAAEYYLIRAIEAGNYKYYATFNLNTGIVSATGGSNFVSAQMQSISNGWYRCTIFISATTPGSPGAVAFPDNITPPTNTPASYTGDGVSGAYFWGAQIETGTNLTAYDYGGLKGTVLVAGRDGTAIDNISLPTGVFSLGPATYTGGTPGILRAVGDIVGYTLIGRTATSVEQDQLIDFYKFRGAKGKLIQGRNLVQNGNFSNGLTGWSTTPATGTFEITSNILRITATQNTSFPSVGIDVPYTLKRYHLLKFTIPATLYSGYPPVYVSASHGGGTGFSVGYYGVGTHSIISYANPVYSAFLRIGIGISRLAGAPQIGDWGEITNVELYELRPKEEW